MTRWRREPPPDEIQPGDFDADAYAGVISPRALRTVERAISPRTGRMVARSTAQAEYWVSRDSLPSRTEAMHGGLWDFDQEAALGPRRGPGKPPRHDAEPMAAFFLAHGNRLSAADWELYKLFWERNQSYLEIARRIDGTREGVYQRIKKLRVRMERARR